MTKVATNQLIGLMADESNRLLVGLVGILKSGHAFVPIDPAYPAERAEFILNDCRVEILVTESKYLAQAHELSERCASLRHIICLDELDSRAPVVEAQPDPLPESLAYVIYTSGSTGKPKGVPITHENLLPLLRWSRDYFGFSEHTKVLQNLSYCFDFGVFELLTTILFGGTIYFPAAFRENPRWGYAEFVNEHGINTIHTTPTAFREIIVPGGKLESLEVLHLGGEQLTKNSVDEIAAQVGEHCVVFNGYGPTEATINCAIFKLGAISDFNEQRINIPIGRASAANTLFVLDRHLQLVPPGAPGELYVGGAGLASGYLNRPGVSADRFIPNQFSDEPGARLYRTGDLVRLLSDGNLEFLGRVDHQVKIRGHRIELGEIETALYAHPAIRECAVLAIEDSRGEKRLAAYLSCPPDQEINVRELRLFLKRSLPEYMVPNVFVPLAALPMTPNGKLDRRALPAPDFISTEADESYIGPTTPTEEVVANICAEVLSLKRLGLHENLFDVGCHSLLATKIVSRLRDAFQAELSLLHVFQTPTVAGLACAVATNQGAEQYIEAPPLRPFAHNGQAPLSFPQERLWFLSQLDPTSTSYSVPRALRIKGRLDIKALEETFSEIIRRHEILRTTFPVVDGTAVQMIHPPQPVTIPQLDFSDLAEADRDEEIRRVVLEEGGRPFDLERGPLLRLKLVRCGPEHHVLLLTEQHLIHDGWTQGVLIRELLSIYTAFSAAQPSPLPELPIQYADFTLWQRQWLKGEVLDQLLSYWKKQLAGAAPFLSVPAHRPRPAVQTYRGAQLTVDLPAPLAEALRTLSRREGVTLFMVLLSAFKALLSRYTGQADISVGTGIANRRWREIESLIGMIINTIVLRTKLDGDPTFRELLMRVREVCLGAYAHQDLPFDKLVEALQPARDPSYSPLFQVMFALHDAPEQSLELPGLELSLIESHNRSAKFDLTVIMIPHYEQAVGVGERNADGSITTLVEYNTDLFDGETIERLWRHYLNILEAITRNVDLPISDLSLLSTDEVELQLESWNHTSTPLQLPTPPHFLVRQHALHAPDSLAVSAPGQSLTFLQLHHAATRLAHLLRGRGAGPERIVAVLLDHSAESVVSVLAALYSSAAYLPIDATYPSERLLLMLEDSRPVTVLTRTELLGRVPAPWSKLALAVDEYWQDLVSESAPEESVELAQPDLEQLAYVIYTSGSTGTPRAVGVTHRGLANLVEWHLRSYEITAADRASLLAGVAFDASVWELWPHLAAGASLHVPELEVRHSAADLAAWLVHQRITRSFVPTPMAEALCDENLAKADLQTLLTGGDRLRRGGRAEWSFKFVNHYGPTESSVVATSGEIAPEEATPSIGRPISNTRAYVLDAKMQPVPIGVTGELYIGGDGLARGYLNRQAQTAERFVPDPFSEKPGGRLYRTGDLVRYRSTGNLEFLGRVDHQVKIRGFRIELGEIEAVLLAHAQVRECVVLAREDRPGEKRLVAHVVAAEETLSPVELRAHLKERLPDYMLPASFIFLDKLPLTPNGKLDRQALPVPGIAGAPVVDYEPPCSATEELLAYSFADLLQLERVSRHESFFDLGGHSLLATQLVSRLRASLEVEVPLRLIFEEPTVAALATHIEQLRAESLGSTATPLLRKVKRITSDGQKEEQWPLSYAQRRLWFLEQVDPGNAVYNVPAAVRLSGQLDLEALERTLTEIVCRHESLRTTFKLVGGEPVQCIDAPNPVSISVTDLSHLSELEAEREVIRLAKAEASRGFTLEQSPPWRVRLLRQSGERHVLLIVMHHIISDGWSTGVLSREVAALYGQYCGRAEATLPEVEIQYRDYAVWQREWLSGEELERQLSYWRDRMAGAPEAIEFPMDHARPAIQTHRGAVQQFTVDGELSASLRRLARKEGATLFMVLLAAFEALLFRYTGQKDLVVGTPVAGRTRAEMEGLIGFFVNTLALRTELTGCESFGALVNKVRQVCLGAYAHQDLPFERLVEELQPDRDNTRTPLFQVMFTMREDTPAELHLPGLSVSTVALETGTAKFDLTLTMLENGAELGGKLEFNTDLFDHSAIAQLIRHFTMLLKSVVDNAEESITTLPFMDEAERQQLVAEWNDTTTIYPRNRCIHELFALAAQRWPDQVALICDTQRLTYRELNQRANQLAHYLRKRGVEPETLVGICVERSIEMIVGLLAILKAGGAYVPLDVSYPKARLSFMLEDGRIPFLLTGQLNGSLPAHSAAVIDMYADCERIAQESTDDPISDACADNLAYVIYTSGSTGRPKGTSVTHRNVVRLVKNTNYLDFNEAHVFLQLAPVSFDASTLELWGPLLNGGRLVVYPATRSLTLEELGRIIQAQSITTLWLTAGLFHRMVDANLEALKPLRELLAGGEALSVPHVRQALQRLEGCRVINGYGPTENTTFTCCYPMTSTEQVGNSVSIGKPIANTRVYVLDAEIQLVPVGVTGELYIGGDGLARGYLNRPALTAERFVPDPFSEAPGGRLFRSGDLVRYLSSGELEFLGRMDQQVKIRGFRIELGEVEAALQEYPAVQQAVVTLQEDAGNKLLVAYVVTARSEVPKDRNATAADLRAHLKERLPDYMLPASFVFLDELPLTPNAKLDRRALPSADLSEVVSEQFVAPRNACEERLCAIWAELLPVKRVGIHDNFFMLGGHSLLAIHIITRVREEFKREIPIRRFLEEPTIAALAEVLQRQPEPELAPETIPAITRASRTQSRVKLSSLVQHPTWSAPELN
jgi:amino acid adenylation domain-containing protein